MHTLILVFVIVILCILWAVYRPVRIFVNARICDREATADFVLSTFLGKWKFYNLSASDEKSNITSDPKSNKLPSNLSSFLQKITQIMRACDSISAELNLVIGAKNPALTGQITGLVWVGYGMLKQQLLSQISSIKRIDLQVHPDFDATGLSVDLDCIAELRPGKLIASLITG